MYKNQFVSVAVQANRALVRQRKAERIMNGPQSFAFRLAALNTMSLENRIM